MKRWSAAALILVLAIDCSGRGGRTATAQVAPTAAVITAATATVTRSVQLIGTVQGDQQAMVMSKITGRVARIVCPEGSTVAAGDPILYVVNDVPGMDYQPGPVTAPIAGVVGKLYVEVGQTVAPTMPVAAVASFADRVRVKAAVSDQDLRFVRVGARADVSVTAFPDRTFAGTVSQVTSVIDPLTRAATVEIVVPNRNRELVPGMACGVVLVLEERTGVLALPLTALLAGEPPRVFVVTDGVAHLRAVTVGLVGDERVEVRAGVAAGEQVATTGKELLADGGAVTVVPASP